MTEQTAPSKFEQQRREKLDKIRQFDLDPYGDRIDGVQPAATVKAAFVDDAEGQTARCAGRIVLHRDIGKLIFITLRDSSGTIQLGLSKKNSGGAMGLYQAGRIGRYCRRRRAVGKDQNRRDHNLG